MKKFILSAALLSLSFLTFSFRTTDNSNAVYDVQSDLNNLNTGVAGEFVEFSDHAKVKDDTWSTRRKTWTLTSDGSDINELDKVLSKY